MAKIVNMYRIKVSLLDVPVNQLHRVIDIAGNASFDLLHRIIFQAFDRYDPHLYRFLLTYRETKSMRVLYDCKVMVEDTEMVGPPPWDDPEEIRHDARKFTLDDAQFKEKDFFYYWFDFGDDWLHRLRIEKIFQKENDLPEGAFYVGFIKSVGESPPQYGEDSVWTSDEESALKEKLLALMAALGTPEEVPVSWELVNSMGLGQMLLERGFVDNIGAGDDPVVLNAEGRKQAEVMAKLLDNPVAKRQ
ncbi:MAG: hypothetical protein Q4D61_05975 [Cardiobacteriaceae bacterium]|nr:hypothetical protein [Cardiobacteriaceae bacterium]